MLADGRKQPSPPCGNVSFTFGHVSALVAPAALVFPYSLLIDSSKRFSNSNFFVYVPSISLQEGRVFFNLKSEVLKELNN